MENFLASLLAIVQQLFVLAIMILGLLLIPSGIIGTGPAKSYACWLKGLGKRAIIWFFELPVLLLGFAFAAIFKSNVKPKKKKKKK